ncbi:MAG: hypothetical protein KF841_17165 [Phycisphaerae bacterium]|nr:hypothetical protein [Phycisphaerae bacterium]
MRNAQEFVRKLKQLNAKLKKDGGKATIEAVDDSTRALLMGILCNYAAEQRAAGAVRKIIESVVDMNELRVTAVSDLVGIIGHDYPQARQAATEITQVFNSVFNSLHHLDVSYLKTQSKKAVNAFLEGIDGLTPHAAAFFRNRYLNYNEIPLDENMFSYLHRTKCIPDGISVAEAQRFVSDTLKDREGVNFYMMFKRYGSTHALRKAPRKPEPSATAASARSKKPVAAIAGQHEDDSSAAPKRGKGRAAASSTAASSRAAKPSKSRARKSSASGKSRPTASAGKSSTRDRTSRK